MTKKIFAMFLAVLMVVSMLPTTVFAANECPGAGKHTANNCDCTVIEVTEPTCGKAGFTTYKCKVCKETFADNYVPATGEHSMVAGEAKAPTCGAAGYEAGTECENCDLVIPGAAIAPVVKAGISCEYKDMTPDIDCTTGGVKTFQCVVCNHSYTVKIDKGEHNWLFGELYVKSAPANGEAGIAVIPCEYCSAAKEIEWFGAHSCAEAVQKHDAVAPTCTTMGEIEHYECRVCGKIYADAECEDELRANEWADAEAAKVGYEGHGILLLGGHTPKSYKNICEAQEVECKVCKEKYVLTLGHSYDWAAMYANMVDPTCTTPGYITGACARCDEPYVQTIPALGHISKTVSVPATCGTYAYTFTYCMNEACTSVKSENENLIKWFDKSSVEYDLTVDYTVADEFIAYSELMQVSYNLSLFQAYYDEPLYLTGNMSGYYLETSFDPADAAEVKLEKVYDYQGNVVKNAFYLNVNGKYIQIYERFDGDPGYGSWKPSVQYTNKAAASVFVLNEELGIFTVTLKHGEYFLNAYNNYTTVGASDVYYATSETTYPVVLSYETYNGVDLVSNPKVDVKGGYDANNHNLTYDIYKYPTCSEEGSALAYCFNHNCTYSTTVTLDKTSHDWTYLNNGDEEGLQLVLDAGYIVSINKLKVAKSCTKDGYQFRVCEHCGEVDKKIDYAKGHKYETKYAPKYEKADHDTVGGYFYECKNGCGERNYLMTESWKGMNKTWTTEDEAMENHDNLLINKTLYRDGDCETMGLYRYFCTGCEKFVYVKQWKTLTDEDGNVVKDPATGLDFQYITGQHPAMPWKTVVDEATGAMKWVVDPALPMYYNADGSMKSYCMPYYQAPTCEEKGKLYTYECACCGEVQGEAQVGEFIEIDTVDHLWYANFDIDPDTNPCPNGVPYSCYYCGQNKNIFISAINSDYLCESLNFEYYLCSCGEEHIRGLYGAFGHEFVNVVAYTAPTHFTTGSVTYKCTYCAKTKTVELDKTPHENKDEEKFTDKCTDTVTDRHCVLCCTCANKGNKHDCYTCDENKDGILDCACMIPSYHHWAVASLKDSTCTMLPYLVKICADCGKQTLDVEYSFMQNVDMTDLVPVYDTDGKTVLYYEFSAEKLAEYVVTKDGKTTAKVPTASVDFKGHKPAEVDYLKDENGDFVLVEGEKVEVRYANYVYVEDYEWTSYQWVAVNVPYVVVTADAQGFPVYTVKYRVENRLIETVETYVAKFLAYEEKTYSTDGYEKMYCQICNAEVEQTMAKKAGIGFELDFANANGAAGYGFGSLVEVTVSVNSLTSSIYGFEFEVMNNGGMVFVGYEVVNDNFAVTVTEPMVAVKDGLKVIGHAVNTVDGKMQNIAISEKTALVKLYFRNANIAGGKTYFWFADAEAQKVQNATAKTLANIDANYEDAYIKARGLLDFNNDGSASSADMYQAMTLLTGEHPNGLTYDVTVDLNKDGEVTLEDLSIGYNYLVGNVSAIELLFVGMDDAEMELFMYIFSAIEIKCVHCGTVVDADALYCSHCGRNPQAK